MGFRISKLSGNREEVIKSTIDFGENGTLTMWSTPGKLTVSTARRLTLAEKQSDFGTLVDILLSVIVDWDMVDDNDEKLPLEPGSLDGMPISGLMTMLDAMGKSSTQEPTKPASSPSTSIARTSRKPKSGPAAASRSRRT